MESILNGVLGQEGNAVRVKVKDSFLLLISHRFTLIIADIFLSYTSFLNYGFVPKFNNKPASIFVAYPPSSRTTGLRRGGRAFK